MLRLCDAFCNVRLILCSAPEVRTPILLYIYDTSLLDMLKDLLYICAEAIMHLMMHKYICVQELLLLFHGNVMLVRTK